MLNNHSLQTMICLIALFSALSGCTSQAKYPQQAPDIHVNLGIAYLQQGDLEKSRMALNQALLDQPQAPASWGAMAYLEEITGNLTVAANDYRRAIQLNPSEGEAYNNYGVFLCRHHQPQAGITEILIAATLPRYVYRATAYENAGLCASTIPDPAAAQTYFKAALRNGKRSIGE